MQQQVRQYMDQKKVASERMSSLRPFLAHAGTEMFYEQESEQADRAKIQNLMLGQSKPLNFPIFNASNKLWVQNMAREGMILSDPLYVMPVIYQGCNLTDGATLYGVEENTPDTRGVTRGVIQLPFQKPIYQTASSCGRLRKIAQ